MIRCSFLNAPPVESIRVARSLDGCGFAETLWGLGWHLLVRPGDRALQGVAPLGAFAQVARSSKALGCAIARCFD